MTVTAARARRPGVGRLLSLALALVALGFVAWVIPLRDRCWDPHAPKSTHVAVTRDASGCVLHLASGDVPIDAASCASLRCEPGVVSTLGGARADVLAGLLALYALGTFAWAARWRALLGFADVGAEKLRIAEVWRISIEAQAGGILLPGGLGGDAFRVASIVGRRRAPTPTRETRPALAIVVASVLLDRAIGLSLIAAVAAGLGFAFAGDGVGKGAGTLLAVLAAIPLGVGVSLALLRAAPGALFLKLLHKRSSGEGRVPRVIRAFESAIAPVLAYLRDPRAPRAIAVAVAWSVVVAVTQLVVVRGLVFALGAAPSAEKWVYVGAAMAFIVGAVPALPGGWGTADATYVFFFGLAGLAAGVGLSVCLLFRLFWYLSGIVGGILHLTRSHRAAGDAPAGPLGNS